MSQDTQINPASNPTRATTVQYLKNLRDKIVSTFEAYEQGAKFERKSWPYQKGEGGGEISMLRGEHFEKAAVNWSGVAGPQFPGQTDNVPFFATGLSLITHMKNPKIPTAHFNIRYIEKGENWWLGG